MGLDKLLIILNILLWGDVLILLIKRGFFTKFVFKLLGKRKELPFATEPWREEYKHMFDNCPILSSCKDLFKGLSYEEAEDVPR